MTEHWITWEPIEGLAQQYCVESLQETSNSFEIVLSDYTNNNHMLRIFFEKSVWAYRRTYESFRNYDLEELYKTYGEEFYTQWSLFKIENSTYLAWLSQQSYGVTDGLKLTHFCFFAVDAVIDVAAAYEPTIIVK